MKQNTQIQKKIETTSKTLQKVITEISDLVDEVKEQGKLTDVCETWLILKDGNTEWDTLRKQLYKIKDFLEKGYLPEQFENQDLIKITSDDLGRSFYPQTKFSASFLDKEAGFNWLRDHGAGDLVTETVNAGTLSAYVKDLMLSEGVEPPEDIVKTSSYKTMGSSKYTPKKKVG